VVRRVMILPALAAALAGCGGGDPSSSPPPQRAAAARVAPELVFFQRQGAAGATLDTFTVRADGTARLEKRYGGAGGLFKNLELEPGQLGALRRELSRLPRGGTLERGAPPALGANYLMRYHGRTLTGRAGGIAPAARPAVRRLDGYIDGIGVGKPTRESATHAG
jgi:hypothetical protein